MLLTLALAAVMAAPRPTAPAPYVPTPRTEMVLAFADPKAYPRPRAKAKKPTDPQVLARRKAREGLGLKARR